MSAELIYAGDAPAKETLISGEVGFNSEREGVLDVIKDMVGKLTKDRRSQRSMLSRSREVVRENAPRLRKAARYSTEKVNRWIHGGGRWRSFMITVTGLIALIGLSGVAAFLIFLIIATANTVVIALLGSVAAVGACIAIFFTALTAIYVGALSFAAFFISSICMLSIFAMLTAAGWIGFWWALWTGVRKGVGTAQTQTRAYLASKISPEPTEGTTKIAVIEGKPHTLTAHTVTL
ncbi:hypothetical protein R1sor_005208 [Riccia sorocarpa]|uniref:Uncharacterized protein n=1 Tax=Riccia sorocarpa TaxID=122646 RepID=A0ABD3HMD5_9MARC